MQPSLTAGKKRIESIDILRGIAMVLMALDHARDYFHITANTDDPLNLLTTTPALYFTRWITHFCAPIFVFLSGTSVYLQGLRKTKKELGIFLLKRGLWLIFAEWVIVTFAWSFNPSFNIFSFQVIWAIGISMFIIGLLILMRLSYTSIFILGLIIVFGHNILDIPEAAPGFKAGFWWDLFHHGHFSPYRLGPDHYVLLVYPFPPWTGLMMLGYCAGKLYSPDFSMVQRRKILTFTGLGLILFFAVFRYFNIYGDTENWTGQKNGLYTFLSFMNVNKYPPSLLFLSITIGPSLVLLAFIEKIKNRVSGIFSVYGRTAFFYYIIHLYLIHLVAAICFFARGHAFKEGLHSSRFLFYFIAPGEGYHLWTVYGVWIAVVIILYPLCRRYDKYKQGHKDKWWLSYL